MIVKVDAVSKKGVLIDGRCIVVIVTIIIILYVLPLTSIHNENEICKAANYEHVSYDKQVRKGYVYCCSDVYVQNVKVMNSTNCGAVKS